MTHKRLVKFLVSGLINTAVGLLSFVVFLEVFNFSAPVANALSYSMGFISALIGMRLWVFPNRANPVAYLVRFSTVFLLCVLANALVFRLVLVVVPGTPILAQIAGMGTYTFLFFLLSSKFLQDSEGFRNSGPTESDSSPSTS